jgi:hypothetical protein
MAFSEESRSLLVIVEVLEKVLGEDAASGVGGQRKGGSAVTNTGDSFSRKAVDVDPAV